MAVKFSAYKIRMVSGLTAKPGSDTLFVPYKPGDAQAQFDTTPFTSLMIVASKRLYREDTDTYLISFEPTGFTITWTHPYDSIGDTDDVTIALNIFSSLTVAVDIADVNQVVTDHVAEPDPHTQYALEADVAAALAGRQPINTNLTEIAALVTTAFGRGLLTEANAASLRATLGLGTAALLNAVETRNPQFVSTVTGTANAIVLAPTLEPPAATAGWGFLFLATANNTGPVTIEIPPFGVCTLRDQFGVQLSADVIRASGLYYAESVGASEFRLLGVADPTVLFNVPPKFFGFRLNTTNLFVDIDEQLAAIEAYRDWTLTMPAANFAVNASQNLTVTY